MDQNFEQQGFEKDLERIGKEVRERITAPETSQQGTVDHREVIREVTRPIVYPLQATSTPTSDDSDGMLPAYAATFPQETRARAEGLIRLAVEKGIYAAAEEARKTGDAALIDTFHDAITTKLFEEFKRRGII